MMMMMMRTSSSLIVALSLSLLSLTLLTTTCQADVDAATSTIASLEKLSFETLPDVRLPKPMSDFTVTRDPNAPTMVYITGGCDAPNGNVYQTDIGEFTCSSCSDQLYRWDLTTMQFTTLANMPVKRYRHAAVLVDGRLWLLGGRNTDDDGLIATVDVYDIATDLWKTYDLPEKYQRSDHGGFGDGIDVAYFVGGYNATYGFLNGLLAIDTAATTDTDLVLIDKSPLLLARGDLSVTTRDDNQVAYVSGGFGTEHEWCEPLVEVEEYDLKNDAWKFLGSLNRGRSDMVVIEYKHDVLLTMGGERQIVGICDMAAGDEPEVGEKTIAVDDVEIYDPVLNTWQVWMEELTTDRFRFAGLDYNGQIYVLGGQKSFDASCQCFRATDEVALLAPNNDAGATSTDGGKNNDQAGGGNVQGSSTTTTSTTTKPSSSASMYQMGQGSSFLLVLLTMGLAGLLSLL